MKNTVMKALESIGCESMKASLAHVGAVLTGQVQIEKVQVEKGQLVARLAALRADYNQLKQESDELLRYADRELQGLKQTNAGLAKEFDNLQLRVWELEQQVDELLLYIADLTGGKAESPELEEIDLSHLALGVVGGHAATVREAINELSTIYGLQRWVVVPPTWESNVRTNELKRKLQHCDLIVIVTGYMNHSLTDAVLGLNTRGALTGKVVLLNFRGKSGVVREILKQVALLDDFSRAL